jgi:acyl-CoA synthetase (AMP-forming)/AMP-acid ligase II
MALLRYDQGRDEVVRNRFGLCVPARPGEAGLLVGRISAKNEFVGYTSEAATERKVLRDVLWPGDAWFNTGDLLRADLRGHLFFVDRLGDTFRWKGENVSTGEVAEVLAGCAGIAEATVYGVSVPGHEGRAGMAAVVADAAFDGGRLFGEVQRALPDYAQPRFVRLVDAMETTGTFKRRKGGLQADGFGPDVADVHVRDAVARAYVRLDETRRARLADGTLRI